MFIMSFIRHIKKVNNVIKGEIFMARNVIKSKIRTVSEILRIERNYFDKEYKEVNEDKREKILDDKNINDINITHAKINEFRKLYDLKEKDYPDELIIKALIRYRGNRELAFQSIFY